MTLISYALTFLAGAITTLSPCVLPALPLIVSGATQKKRSGPVWIAAGLITSFIILGTAVTMVVPRIGLDPEMIRQGAGIILILVGFTQFITRLQNRLQGWLSPIATYAARLAPGDSSSPASQFFLGTLLGAVWSPCIGPTLGAAIGLASQSSTLLSGMTMLLAFGSGSAVPLLMVAYTSRKFFANSRAGLIRWTEKLKPIMGGALFVLGVGILTGWDKLIEARILNVLPESWANLIGTI